jgi:hypothetical protein
MPRPVPRGEPPKLMLPHDEPDSAAMANPTFAKWPLGASASWLTRNNIASRRPRTTANLGARVAADSAVIRQGTHDLE